MSFRLLARKGVGKKRLSEGKLSGARIDADMLLEDAGRPIADAAADCAQVIASGSGVVGPLAAFYVMCTMVCPENAEEAGPWA